MEENEMKTIDERLARIESLVLIGAKEVLTIDECAMYTGYSRNYIYRLTSQRAIPCYKPGVDCFHFILFHISPCL